MSERKITEKRTLSIIAIVILVMISVMMPVMALDYSFFGGIKGDLTLKAGVYYYQEVVFLSGEPIVMNGTITVPEIKDEYKDSYKVAIKYQVENQDKQATLDRTVTYDVVNKVDPSTSQIITNVTIPIGGLKESLKIGSDIYTLTSFQFSNANIIEKNPAINFESGNIYYKKVFHVNGVENTATRRITLIGESETDLGFSNKYSSINTSLIKLSLVEDNPKTGQLNWDGIAYLKFSDRYACNFSFVNNDVQNISFRGGLLKSENTENFLHYNFDLPSISTTAPTTPPPTTPPATPATGTTTVNNTLRKKGEADLNTYRFEKSTRLIIPKFLDVGDHWASDNIFKLASLSAFDANQYFFPDIYITREQFAKAVVNAIDYLAPETQEQIKQAVIKQSRPNAKPLTFTDVKRDSEYYIYIEKANELKLMKGEGNKQFLPSRPLTRAEAITIIVRALGIESQAPALPFDTGFIDDSRIPNWSKGAIYMAHKIGIVGGYPDDSIRPLELMKRAEAAKMLDAFIEHLRSEITVDYREKLLNR